MKVSGITREEVAARATVAYDALGGNARAVLVQLFLDGPTWDGHLVSKQGRDTLVLEGLAEQSWGFQWLNQNGVLTAAFATQSTSESGGHGPVIARKWRCKQTR